MVTGSGGEEIKRKSRPKIATKLTKLIYHRETSDEKDEGSQQPQVGQATRESDFCESLGAQPSDSHGINGQHQNDQRVVS